MYFIQLLRAFQNINKLEQTGANIIFKWISYKNICHKQSGAVEACWAHNIH